MQTSNHAKQRMSQRGVSREMVDLVLTHGAVENDRYVMSRKEADRLIEEMQRDLRVLQKIRDKGGVVVVSTDDTLITTYNFQGQRNH